MERYVRWHRDGYLSCTGECFDIGTTTSAGLHRFLRTGEPFSGAADPRQAGNGSIMRLAPVPMFFYPDVAKSCHYAAESSRTTHGAQECIDACRLYAVIASRMTSFTAMLTSGNRLYAVKANRKTSPAPGV